MVPSLGGVVEKSAVVGVADDVFKVVVFKWRANKEVVEIVDVGFFVFAVVEVDGVGRDDRSQGVGSIR